MSDIAIIGESLDFSSLRGKRVLVRLDLNVPLDSGSVRDNLRLRIVLPTLRALQQAGAKIIIMGHVGRPKGEVNKEFTLLPVRDELESLLGVEIAFASDCVGAEAKFVSDSLQDGEIGMLENLRFHLEETANDKAFAKQLSSLADIYINEAFSVSHRAHSSIVGVNQFLPSYGGLSMAEELARLHEVCSEPRHPLALVIGGSKISTKIQIIENLLDKIDFLVIGGAMANTFFMASGLSVGASLVEADYCQVASDILAKAKSSNVEVILPSDAVVSHSLTGALTGALTGEGGIETKPIDSIADEDMILDIGESSVARICEVLGQCQTLLWNGPLGAFEYEAFGAGTFSSMQEASRLTASGKLRTIAGGGDTAYALDKAGVRDNFTYVSGAGGAFLAYLEGKSLPGVEALKANSSS